MKRHGIRKCSKGRFEQHNPQPNALKIGYGPVLIARGRYKGRVGWYDDDETNPKLQARIELEDPDDDRLEEMANDYEDWAIVYLEPTPGEYVLIPKGNLRNLPEDAETVPDWMRDQDEGMYTPRALNRGGIKINDAIRQQNEKHALIKAALEKFRN